MSKYHVLLLFIIRRTGESIGIWFFYSPNRRIYMYLYLILMMHMEVGPVRVLHPVFEEVVNNSFGLNLYPFRAVK